MVPVLFKISLRQLEDDPMVNVDHRFGVEPLKINSPATDSEVALAVRVLEGCCLLYLGCAALAHQHKAIKVDSMLPWDACFSIPPASIFTKKIH